MANSSFLILTTVSLNGAPFAGDAPMARFDSRGGTVGRADTNHLVLPDPDRTVSRVHAQIVWRDGYVLIDRGSNPVLVNGQPLEPGEEVTLTEGASIQVGGYVLRATLESDEQTTVAVPAPVSSAPAPDDLFAGLAPASPAPASDDPFADLLSDFAPSSDRAAPPPSEPLGLGNDAFGAAPPAHPDDFGIGGPADASLDELFGLQGSPQGADPFASLSPASSEAADPLAGLLGSAEAPPAAAIPDDVFEIHSAFNAPREAPRPASQGSGGAARPEPPASVDPLAGLVAPDVAPAPAPAPAGRVPTAPPAGDDALLAALRQGLGVPDLPLPPLTPELARAIGVLLREATQGTLDLLLARAATKREVRAEVTMILAKDNNPLKFSPTVEVALQHLLAAAPTRGFMAAPDAMRDAYDDLRAHQFGFMAGMRAALAGILERFDPAVLEQRLAGNTVLDKLPMARRARLWDLFTQLYGDISREAADNFHQAFGKAFLQAYQEQIDSLDQQRRTDR